MPDSSNPKAPGPLEEELQTFLKHHDLDDALFGPMYQLVRRTALHLYEVAETTLESPPTVGTPPALPPLATLSEQARLSVFKERYDDIEPIAHGGMGELRRVRDRLLNRRMVVKILRPDKELTPDKAALFVAEAQVTAQLQHPGVVPVHDLGVLPDGRVWFTMKEISGITLLEAIRLVHSRAAGGRWIPVEGGWTFRRLIEVFRRVCETVAFAHSRGVLHRDLKPANIMVGGFGEVMVLDWGIAKVVRTVQESAEEDLETEEIIETTRTVDSTRGTLHGTIIGTPSYMAPEQARGMTDAIGPQTDVYGLGATLYHILSGAPPFPGRSNKSIRRKLLRGSAPSLTAAATEARGPLPTELIDICDKAMAAEPAGRFKDAQEVASLVARWLDGAWRHDQAMAILAETDELLPQITASREEAARLRDEAASRLAGIPATAPVAQKQSAWSMEDRAIALAREAATQEARRLQRIQGALTFVPDLPDAHDRLAATFHARHQDAERRMDEDAAARYEQLLRLHNTGRYDSYLKGTGRLTLHTAPAEARADLYRYVEQSRRLVPIYESSLGRTPMVDAPLEMGSYLVELSAPGHHTIRYPVCIRREQIWHGQAPGSDQPAAIPLPPVGTLGPDDVYVPAGWTELGNPGNDEQSPLRTAWIDGFVVRRFPLTVREYIAFLDDIRAREGLDAALRLAPRTRGKSPEELGTLVLGVTDTGFVPTTDADGDTWQWDWPVFMVNWRQARAYCAWIAEQTGLPWRLPRSDEWEKASRGADARTFPWGNRYDPTFACNRDFAPTRPLPQVVDSFPVDESPYGVRGLAGNSVDWCADGPGDEAIAWIRGSGFSTFSRGARLFRRDAVNKNQVFPGLGLRLARSLPER
ncbi:MAG: SUMF1/EgtB/PvdO family nonheme iron enzyme [Alphaproteobacteria bacterium]|nr:SUMF1/EgtB/PvdO family nonheme iron enzyme [Alphaproteobacteria bacterium]